MSRVGRGTSRAPSSTVPCRHRSLRPAHWMPPLARPALRSFPRGRLPRPHRSRSGVSGRLVSVNCPAAIYLSISPGGQRQCARCRRLSQPLPPLRAAHRGEEPVAACTVYHDGQPPRSFADAANVWIMDPLLFYDPGSRQYASCGVSPLDTDHHLRAFRGYWLYTFVDDVTLGIPPR